LSIAMSIDPKLPERPGGEPIVVVVIEDHGSIVINTGSSKELFKFVFGDNVSKHRVTKLAIPGPPDCDRYVTLIIGFRLHIDLDNGNARVVFMLIDPWG